MRGAHTTSTMEYRVGEKPLGGEDLDCTRLVKSGLGQSILSLFMLSWAR